MVDSDVVRGEIEKTVQRIAAEVELLTARARGVKRAAFTCAVATVTVVATFAAVLLWRRARRAPSDTQRLGPPRSEGRPSRFGGVRIAGRGSNARATA